jgi:hypothetical protein
MTRSGLQNLINANLANNSEITAAEHRAVEFALLNEAARLYEVKELDIPDLQLSTFLIENFDITGLGINDYTGFAICNGQNGTRNRGGKTSIGYDATSYSTIGANGGEQNHTLTSSELPVVLEYLGTPQSGGRPAFGGGPTVYWPTAYNNTRNSGQTHNNMQPYIVTLFIQRIS